MREVMPLLRDTQARGLVRSVRAAHQEQGSTGPEVAITIAQ